MNNTKSNNPCNPTAGIIVLNKDPYYPTINYFEYCNDYIHAHIS
jgi:hypothetical protein